MSHRSVFHYKWSYEGEYADVNQQFTIKWNDPIVGVDWPIDNPILSRRDK
jgi:dTDP-4-dehydrorhamnose 3,5-epimerase